MFATVAVLLAYVVVPQAVGWLGVIVSSILGYIRSGADVFSAASTEAYLRKLFTFLGQLTLLVGTGLLAWRNREAFCVRQSCSLRREAAIGLVVGLANYYCATRLIVPWLYSARPMNSEGWMTADYRPIVSYGQAYMTQVTNVFFVSAVYSPIVQTLVFVGFLYRKVRMVWGATASVLFTALIFGSMHLDSLFFLKFLFFGLVNLVLYELRASLVAPTIHHITFNVMIFGSQLAIFEGIPVAK